MAAFSNWLPSEVSTQFEEPSRSCDNTHPSSEDILRLPQAFSFKLTQNLFRGMPIKEDILKKKFNRAATLH